MRGTWQRTGLELDPAGYLRLAVQLAAHVALGDGASLVVRLLAARHADLELRDTARQVHLQRHDGQPLGRLQPEELGDLIAMEQQLSGARWRMVVAISLRELG